MKPFDYLMFLVLASVAIIQCHKSGKPYSKPLIPRRSNLLREKDDEYSIYYFEEGSANGKSGVQKDVTPTQKEKELLYEAYNMLHTLAQDFQKPFDAPAVIVVGHQTSGKSALIEALMGFQFNQVGGGTKTRRPVALRMQYNPDCLTPVCFLTQENGREQERSLEDIQEYIEAENRRLERDPSRSFDAREINVRMEYRYCPNMIVIDTPGMLHPPKGKQLTSQQRALAHAAREAENLVLSKIRCQDYIILCVEDTTDWKHATTRNIVMQADPQLLRTVLVTTKLDTKLPQFSEPEDLEDFIQAPLIKALFSQLLGGPYFTSVPSGRVGANKEFDSNQAFVRSLKQAERRDRSLVLGKLGPVRSRECLPRVGVSRLRTFLEERVEVCYRRNVAKIVPLLQSELRHTEARLAQVDQELGSLSIEHLRVMANSYREAFSKQLNNAIQGTVRVSPEQWGETIETEAVRSGSFLQQHSKHVSPDAWQNVLANEVGNSAHKLFGGAQYHRALKEFTVAVRHLPTQPVSEDEIANAAGIGDRHDGVNFMRAACVIAMEKAQISFEPMLEALRSRLDHIMKRLYPIVEELINKQAKIYNSDGTSSALLDSQGAPFQRVIQSIYEKFVDKQMSSCLQKCRDDLFGMTRFVTWDVEDQGGSSTLYRMLPTPQKMVEVYNIAVDRKQRQQNGAAHYYESDELEEAGNEDAEDDVSSKILEDWDRANGDSPETKSQNINEKGKKFWKKNSDDGPQSNDNSVAGYQRHSPQELAVASPDRANAMVTNPEEDAALTDYYRVLQLTEEMIQGTSASRTSALVSALVQFIISSWRNHFARSTAMKFNCFFLMPFMDEFPDFLRDELDRVYETGVSDMFDVTETRRALQTKRSELLAECAANSKLQERFDTIASQLNIKTSSSADSSLDSGFDSYDDFESHADSADSSSSKKRSSKRRKQKSAPKQVRSDEDFDTDYDDDSWDDVIGMFDSEE